MTTPVTLAGQGVLLEPGEADDLADLLLQAATVLHCLAGAPEAEAAAAEAAAGGCQELAIGLQLAAAGIAERAEAAPPAAPGKEEQTTEQTGAAWKHPRNARKNKHSEPGF
jgi:hypothetical protein